MKLGIVEGRGQEAHNTKEVKKEHKEKIKKDEEATTDEEHETPVTLVTHINKIVHSIFSNVDVYVNNQQVYNSNGLYMLKSYISNNFNGAKGALHCEGYNNDEFSNQIMEASSSEFFFTRRIKMLSKPVAFMLYAKLGVGFFSSSELPHPNMKVRLRLIRAKPSFYIISNNPNFGFGNVDCSIYTRRIDLKNDYHKKPMDMLAYTPVEFNYLQTLAKIFVIPSRQNQFIQENIFNNAPVRRIAIAMDTNSAFIGSYSKNSF